MRPLLLAAAGFILLVGLLFLAGAFDNGSNGMDSAADQAMESAPTVDDDGSSFDVDTGSMSVAGDSGSEAASASATSAEDDSIAPGATAEPAAP